MSHRKIDYDCATICWVYRTLTDVTESRERTLLPLVLRARTSVACYDIVQWNCYYPHKGTRILSASHCRASGPADRAER